MRQLRPDWPNDWRADVEADIELARVLNGLPARRCLRPDHRVGGEGAVGRLDALRRE
jgi:hypothetical protein